MAIAKLNKEGKIVYGLNTFATLYIIVCLLALPEIMKTDIYMISTFLVVSVLFTINLFPKNEGVVWIYHVFVTFFTFTGAFLCRTRPLLALYLVILGATLIAWFFNDNKCYLTHMTYDGVPTTKKGPDGQRSFVRTKFISKYRLDYALLIIFTVIASCRLLPNRIKNKIYDSTKKLKKNIVSSTTHSKTMQDV